MKAGATLKPASGSGGMRTWRLIIMTRLWVS